jgi:UDP-glucose 6-dehydrogenase
MKLGQSTDFQCEQTAVVTRAIDAKEAFSAEFLKGVEGVYDLFVKDRIILLDNCECSVAIALTQTQ